MATAFDASISISNPVMDSAYPKGYVTKALLEKTIPDAKTEGLKILFCGPPAMESAIAGQRGLFPWSQGSVGGVLKEMGYSQEQVTKL